MSRWTQLKSAVLWGGCSMSLGPSRKVSPTDHSPCTRHDEYLAVYRPQLPPADDGSIDVLMG